MNFKMLSEKLYTHSGFRITAHLLFWIMQLLVNWYITTISFNTYNHFKQPVLLLLLLSNTINLMLFYYPLVYYIFPRFEKRKYLTGISGVLVLFLLYNLINTLTERLILNQCDSCLQQLKDSGTGYYEFLQLAWPNRLFAKMASFGVFFSLIFSLSTPIAIKIALQAFKHQLAVTRLAKENVELEFNFLKSQVNPHFLFNSLNNIYGLILKNENTKAAGTVARLSEFLRYTLYHSSNDKMPLKKEIQLLKDYIELEGIRLNYTKVTFSIEADDDTHDFPSLLLIPVIENAFKYSTDHPGAEINILLLVRAGQLDFTIANRVDEDRVLQTAGGIGLQNLKKRLSLYYPGKYQYEVDTTDINYTAKITIDL